MCTLRSGGTSSQRMTHIERSAAFVKKLFSHWSDGQYIITADGTIAWALKQTDQPRIAMLTGLKPSFGDLTKTCAHEVSLSLAVSLENCRNPSPYTRPEKRPDGDSSSCAVEIQSLRVIQRTGLPHISAGQLFPNYAHSRCATVPDYSVHTVIRCPGYTNDIAAKRTSLREAQAVMHQVRIDEHPAA